MCEWLPNDRDSASNPLLLSWVTGKLPVILANKRLATQITGKTPAYFDANDSIESFLQELTGVFPFQAW